MSGLNFSLGGKLDPSFKNSMNQAEREAEATGLRIQNSLRKQISGLDKSMKGMDPTGAQFAKASVDREMLSKNLLMVQNSQFLRAANARIAEGKEEWKRQTAAMRAAPPLAAELACNAGKVAANVEKAAHNAGGLNLIIRETLVVFREIGRGNWTRIPGSLSLIAQGFSTLKGISMATFGAWGVAIAGLVGSVFIYFHRIKQLAKDLTTSLVATFAPEHVARYMSRLEVLNQLHKDVAESARQIKEAHDDVGNSIQRELDLTRDRISYERELLEAQKENALAAAKNPAEREAIEKKFSKLILAKKKEERDAEFKAMQDEVKKIPGEILKTEAEIKRLTDGGGYMSEAQQNQLLKQKQEASDAYKEYRQQLSPGEKDKRDFSADKDRKIINDFNAKQAKFNKLVDENNLDAGLYTITDSDRARRDAAKSRLSDSERTRKDLNNFVDSADERTRERAPVKELEDKVKADKDRLAKLGPRGGGLIEDTLKKNLQKDKQELALENERLKRVDAGRPLSGREVTERERVGFGSPQVALLDVNRSMDRKLGAIESHLRNRGGSGGIVTDAPPGFGD